METAQDPADRRVSSIAAHAILLRHLAHAGGASAVARSRSVVREARRHVGAVHRICHGQDHVPRAPADGVEVLDDDLVGAGDQRRGGVDSVGSVIACIEHVAAASASCVPAPRATMCQGMVSGSSRKGGQVSACGPMKCPIRLAVSNSMTY